MSYDLAVYTTEPLTHDQMSAVVKASDDLVIGGWSQNSLGDPFVFTINRGKRKAYCFTVEGPYSLEPEDVPEDVTADPAVAGQWRDEPVWIGTSSSSPVGADFVAPDARRVPELMEDLMAYAGWNDVQILAQSAIAHAQFETIHPFTDGNGRTGRALLITAARDRWKVTIKARKDAAAWKIADLLARQPVVNAKLLGDRLGLAPATIWRQMQVLEEAGVVKGFDEFKRGRHWRSDEIVAALDSFAARSGRRS